MNERFYSMVLHFKNFRDRRLINFSSKRLSCFNSFDYYQGEMFGHKIYQNGESEVYAELCLVPFVKVDNKNTKYKNRRMQIDCDNNAMFHFQFGECSN